MASGDAAPSTPRGVRPRDVGRGHAHDLARRLADDALTPSDLVAHAASDKKLLRKARREVPDRALGRRDLTLPMRHTRERRGLAYITDRRRQG